MAVIVNADVIRVIDNSSTVSGVLREKQLGFELDNNERMMLNHPSGWLHWSPDETSIPATRIADGSVSNTEFQYLDGASSNIQNQIDNLGSGNIDGSGAANYYALFSDGNTLTSGILEQDNHYITVGGSTEEDLIDTHVGFKLGDGNFLTAEQYDSSTFNMSQNAYYSGVNNWRYLVDNDDNRASLYIQRKGGHEFYGAPSGSVGDQVTWQSNLFIWYDGRVFLGKEDTSYTCSGLTVHRYGYAHDPASDRNESLLKLNSVDGNAGLALEASGTNGTVLIHDGPDDAFKIYSDSHSKYQLGIYDDQVAIMGTNNYLTFGPGNSASGELWWNGSAFVERFKGTRSLYHNSLEISRATSTNFQINPTLDDIDFLIHSSSGVITFDTSEAVATYGDWNHKYGNSYYWYLRPSGDQLALQCESDTFFALHNASGFYIINDDKTMNMHSHGDDFIFDWEPSGLNAVYFAFNSSNVVGMNTSGLFVPNDKTISLGNTITNPYSDVIWDNANNSLIMSVKQTGEVGGSPLKLETADGDIELNLLNASSGNKIILDTGASGAGVQFEGDDVQGSSYAHGSSGNYRFILADENGNLVLGSTDVSKSVS